MALQLLFLGKLADLARAGGHAWQIDGPLDWDSLLARLEPALREEVACDRVRVAVNGVVLADKTGLVAIDGDELALLPPVSGG